MTAASSNALNFFTLEASDCLERMDVALSGGQGAARDGRPGAATAPAINAFLPAARQLRGSAIMYRFRGIAELAGAVERIGRQIAAGTLSWSPALKSALVGAVDSLKILLRSIRTWGPAEDARVASGVAELAAVVERSVQTSTEGIVPITDLAPDDGQPQLVRTRPTTPTGLALRAALEVGITELSQLGDKPLGGEQRRATATPTVRVTRQPEGVVAIQSLLYGGRAALERARELRETVRHSPAGSPATQAALDEIFDLLDLAAVAT